MREAFAWVPAGACDCHVHIFGPFAEFPLGEDRSYTPPEATATHLDRMVAGMGFSRAVIVTATGYNFDNRSLEHALRADPKNRRGIAVLPPDCPPAYLRRLNDLGVKGIRLNLYRRGSEKVYRGGAGLDSLSQLGPAIAEMGWHVQVWVTTVDLAAVLPALQKFPGPIVIDNMCRVVPSKMKEDGGFALLCSLLRNDRFHVKVSGPNRLSENGGDFRDVDPVAQALISAGEDKVVWGSDWPHVAHFDRAPPTEAALLQTFYRWTDSDRQRRKMLVDNPAALYGFLPVTGQRGSGSRPGGENFHAP
jgi:predicted TIM-barrel fold metal-dependent hydrolase